MNRKIVLLISLLFFGCYFTAHGQASICPPNVNFEFGSLANWNFYNGTVTDGPIYHFPAVPSVPYVSREVLTGPPTLDHYGGFPTVAPGGGNYSCMLGSDTNNAVAEQAIYYVEIPAGTTTYELVYHYAADLEIPIPIPHPPDQEPRFVVNAFDSATGAAIPCAAYTYVSGAAGSGFIHSAVTSRIPGNGTDVWYKPWTFGNMKFPGENGRTVAIQFIANACTPGGHFGYGYFDMSCGLFANVIACGTTTETLTAPPGFATYQWMDSTTFAVSYGTTQTITVAAPTSPITYAVIVTPNPGYGCPDTLYSRLIPSNLVLNPSNDTAICAGTNITLTSGATDIATPLTYSWSPAIGLSCTGCATPTANPAVTTAYTVTVLDPGGCSLSHVFNITVFPSPLPISGALNACLGAVTTLTDAVGGGVWSVNNGAVATIGSSNGVVTGLALDTTTITYSFGGGLCSTATVITVNPVPSPVTGSTPVCPGATITLADATTPGTWSSGSIAMATVDPISGVVTGVAALGGDVTMTFTALSGCTASAIVSVNPLSPITGVTHVCTGLTTALADITPGGTWSSSNTLIASVDPSGVVLGVSTIGGTATITFTTPAGCTTTTVVTVNPLPLPITGTASICNGLTTTLHDASTGGTWSSSVGTVATIVTASGLVTGTGTGPGITPGTTTITYTLPTGCLITSIESVNPIPPAITGPGAVCTGAAILLSDGITGGTWSSASAAVATVNSLTGVVGGVSVPGSTTIITYTSPAGCVITTVVTVNPLPGAITGTMAVCAGLTTTLHDASTGGAWSSSIGAVATIGPASGVVTGVLPGTTTITYTVATGCSVTAIVTVNVTPVPITGIATVCVGSTTLLNDGTTGGTWSSGSAAVATVLPPSGLVSGAAAAGGTSIITYALATGCSATDVVTVNPLPALFTVTGGGVYCAGPPTLHVGLSGSTTGVSYQLYLGPTPVGGALPGSGSALDFGIEGTAGTYTVVATNTTTGCSRVMTGSVTITINPLPPLFTVTGGGSFCSGSTGVHVGLSGSTVGINYQLHNGFFIGPIVSGTGGVLDFGVEMLGGTYTVIATNPLTGCTSTMTGSALVTVLPLPALFTVTGGGGYCIGSGGLPVGLSGSVPGTTYELLLGGVTVGTVAGTGLPISFGPQTAAGVYTVFAGIVATGCTTTMTGSVTIVVNPLPDAITGPNTVCVGATITEIDDSTGGTWSSSNTINATIGSTSGIVTGLTSATTTVITYTLPTGCTATRTITVSLSPSVISGPSAVCVGSTITETDTAPTGVWSSSATGTATVGSLTGVVGGVAGGDVTIINTIPSTGCTMSKPVTVNPLPSAISGITHVCVGLSTSLTDLPLGGAWSSSATGVATVTGGLVWGAGPGVATITYTLPTTCLATTTVTVYASPAPIGGPSAVCQATTITLTDGVSGGIWASSITTVATVGSTGVVFPIIPVSTIISYTLPGNCVATKSVTVNPISPITGVPVVCQGSTTLLGDPVFGGTWSSSNTGIATVSLGGGLVSGVAPGISTITYTTSAGCTASIIVTVNITPTPITGTASVCVNSTTLLGDGVPGGVWSTSATGIATISGGTVGGVLAGTSTISYTLATGCAAHEVVTVNPLPALIGGTVTVCDGLTTTLTDGTTGGVWSSSSTSNATVGSLTGIVTGGVAGTTIITYTISLTGCTTSTQVTINALPGPIAGPASICVGYTTALHDAPAGGTWSSSATGIATTGPGSAVDTIYGVSPGTSLITYTLPTGCISTNTVTVVPVPSGLTGGPMVCEGQLITMAPIGGAPGGVWTTGDASIATIMPALGVLTGVASGTVLVSYTIGVGCITFNSIIVDALSPITGDSVFCAGQTVILTDTTQDGVWSSASTTVATAVTATLLTGFVTADAGPGGTASIRYTLPTGCVATYIVTVNPLPAPITGVTNVCVDGTTSLFDATTGGTWSSNNTGIASVDPTSGEVTGMNAGEVTISYILTATGCPMTTTVIVNALPTPISGPAYVCPGASITLTDIGGGTWSVVPSMVATIGLTSGILDGLSPGTATATYTLPITGCNTSSFITVEPWPAAITGNTVACLGSSTNLSDGTLGGVWTSGNTFVATVGLFGGNVYGLSLGTATITYTTSLGCVTTTIVTVDPAPGPITGNAAFCQGATITLGDAAFGGVWSSAPVSIATVDPVAGVVSGIAGGNATISYTLGGVCSSTAIVTVNPLPSTISGATHVCSVGSGTLISIPGGGTWVSSNTAAATILSGSGFITGVSAGTTTITYTLPTGCSVSGIVTVDVMPLDISGPTGVCAGSTVTLADAVSGGVWSSSSSGVATIGSLSGIVSGVAAGTTTISYSIGACAVHLTVNGYALPGIYSVTGGGNYCAGGPGEHIGLSGSAVGVLYFLYNGGTVATGTYPGTGAPLDFGLQTVTGTYTVVAVATATTCSSIMSGSASVGIIPTVTPSVSITETPGTSVCAGTSVTFNPTPVLGGLSPTYQWSVNGVDVSTAGSYTFIPANGDVVAVAMASNVLCPSPAVVSGSVTMTVNVHALPVLGIAVSPGDSVCEGTSVTLTAMPGYGGTAPTYVWMKNGAEESVDPIYAYMPVNGDVIYCIMTSNYPCRLADTARSSNINMTVDTAMIPVVSIVARPGADLGIGMFDTLTATAANAGPNPTYQWFLNGLPVSGATTNTYISNNFAYPKPDSVTCVVTADNICKMTSFEWMYINVNKLGVNSVSAGTSDIVVVPNPNKGEFVVRGSLGVFNDEEVSLEVTDMLGQVVYRSKILAKNGMINERVSLPGTVANGMYLLSLHSEVGNDVFHIVVEQ